MFMSGLDTYFQEVSAHALLKIVEVRNQKN